MPRGSRARGDEAPRARAICRRFRLPRTHRALEEKAGARLELALEGAKRDATHVTCLEISASAAFRMGDAEQAVRLQEKALHFVSERGNEVRGMLRKLAKYRQQLAPTARVP